jgi:predicted phage-related endonuclease
MFEDKEIWTKYHVKAHTPEWYKFRTVGTTEYQGGIGASELGKIIGMDVYSPVAPELFYYKIGLAQPERVINDPIYWGTRLEPEVIHAWKHEDTQGRYAYNEMLYRETQDPKYLIRDSADAKYYLVNNKYPWLFASLDNAILPNQYKIDPNTLTWMVDENGEMVRTQGYCPLECKVLVHYSLKRFEGEMNPTYIAQVHQQMIVTETDYAEIAVLELDNRKLRIYPFRRDERFVDIILEATEEFWYKRVVPGRMLAKDYYAALKRGNEQESSRIFAEIQSLEPEVTSGEAYADWVKKQMKTNTGKVSGNYKHYKLANDYQMLNGFIKCLEDKKSLIQNTLLMDFRNSGIGVIELDNKGKAAIGYNPATERLSIRGIKKPNEGYYMEFLKAMEFI